MTDERDSLSAAFLTARPDEAAAVLATLDPTEVAAFLGTVPARIGAEPLAAMAPWQAGRCLAAMEPVQAAAVLEALPAGQRARCLRVADDAAREAILSGLSNRHARAVRRQLRYPDALVGAWMAGDVITLGGDASVEEALDTLRAQGSDGTHQLYVVDHDGKPIGAVAVSALLRAPAGQRLERLMRRELAPVDANAPVARMEGDPAWGERTERPVVDARGRVVGTLPLARLAELRTQTPRGPTAGAAPSVALLSSYSAAVAGLMRTAVAVFGAAGRSR